MSTAVLLTAQDLTVRYRYQDPPVFKGLSLAVAAGEKLAIMGPSGCGKSTLLAHLAGLRAPQAGVVKLFDADLALTPEISLDQFRARRVGFVFQRACLLPYLTVRENILLAFEAFPAVQRRGLAARLPPLLDRAGLLHKQHERAFVLSVGEAQRVAVLRALAKNPPLVFADEPTGALDGANVDQIADLVCDDPARAVVVVTHDPRVAKRCTRVLRLADGRLTPA